MHCRKCIHRSTEKEYAVKIISRRFVCQQGHTHIHSRTHAHAQYIIYLFFIQRSKPSREVDMLRICQGHPNIVQIHDVLQDEVGIFAVTSYQSPVTSHQSPVTGYQSPVTSHQSPVTSHQLPVTGHQSPVTSYQSPVTSGHNVPPFLLNNDCFFLLFPMVPHYRFTCTL